FNAPQGRRPPQREAPASLLLAELEDPAGAAVAGLHHQAGVVVAAEVAGGDAVPVGEVDRPREDLEVRAGRAADAVQLPPDLAGGRGPVTGAHGYRPAGQQVLGGEALAGGQVVDLVDRVALVVDEVAGV